MSIKKLSTSSIAGALFLTAMPHALAGTIAESQHPWLAKYQKQENAPDPAKMLLNEDQEPDLKSGFVDLFNGKDLSGWTPKGGTASFKAKDGIIIGKVVDDSPSTYLCSDKIDYGDFIFTCDMKWAENLNSGVMFRAATRMKKEHVEVYGPQVEMEGTEGNRCWSGGVYGQSCGGYFYPLWLEEHKTARAALKREGWNRITIEAKGKVVKTWLNGVPVAHWVGDGTYAKGFFGLQVHKAKKGEVHFRNLRVKEL